MCSLNQPESSLLNMLKGESNKIFASDLFTNSYFLSPLLGGYLKLFEFVFEFEEIFAIFDWLSAILYSMHAPYCLIRKVTTPRIVYNKEMQIYELSAETLACHLIRGVVTPYTVSYVESLFPGSFIAASQWWQRGVFFKNKFEGLPLLLKGHWSKKSTMYAVHCSSGTFLKVKNMGCLRFNFWLSSVNDSGSRFIGISNTNKYTKIRQNSKSLSGVSIWTRISGLMETPQKSRWTVPLRESVIPNKTSSHFLEPFWLKARLKIKKLAC